MNKITRAAATVSFTLTMLVLMAGEAFAQATGDPDQIVADAAGDIQGWLSSTAISVLPYAAILVAIAFGWRFARRVVKL